MPALKRRVTLALPWLAVPLSMITGALQAGEYCVACTGPVARYKCTFTGDGSRSQSPGLQLTCISELAKLGGHESCAIERNRQSPCDASAKVYAAPEAFAPPAATEAQSPAPATEPEAPQKRAKPDVAPPADHAADPSASPEQQPLAAADPAPDPNDKPPRTVKEMVDKSAADTKVNAEKAGAAAGEAAKSAGSAVEKAGAAIGNAAKKTWTCLTSLFGEC